MTLPLKALAFFVAAICSAESLLITGARVADGTGGALQSVSVRIVEDHIAEVGPALKPNPGETVLDASGLVLAPGFIDTHNHSTDALDQDPAAESQLAQGITTVLLGQDGGSPLPIADYLRKRNAEPAALNVQVLVGHATVRRKVMGENFRRRATPDEIGRMEALVGQAMEEGAAGLSTGLEYEVGSYSTTEEVIALARVAAKYHGIYVSHIRDEADLTFDALREIIRIGAEAGIPVQISHIKLGTQAVWGKAAEAVQLVEAARAKGQDVTADCYSYDAWASTITVLVPDKKYDNPDSVAKALASVGGARNITVTSCKAHANYEFKTLEAIARLNSETPVEAFIRIVKDGGAGVVCKAMIDADIRTFYRQPWVMVASDGGIGMRHPRGAGTFPRVLGVFVRQRNWLSLPEAIRKMTLLPAARMGLTDRGRIQTGMKADLVLFDPARIIDRSTFAEPLKPAEGVRNVWVNGALVWESGKPTGARPGEVLRRQTTNSARP